ncbi:MAG: tetratricopeptide repeat protein [Sandaracinus sp.]|nr:tetratricopeptide repeat protein [Sandaracinus sp.]
MRRRFSSRCSSRGWTGRRSSRRSKPAWASRTTSRSARSSSARSVRSSKTNARTSKARCKSTGASSRKTRVTAPRGRRSRGSRGRSTATGRSRSSMRRPWRRKASSTKRRRSSRASLLAPFRKPTRAPCARSICGSACSSSRRRTAKPSTRSRCSIAGSNSRTRCSTCTRAASTSPTATKNVVLLLHRAAELQESEAGDSDAAIATYRQALEVDPNDLGAAESLDRLLSGGALGRPRRSPPLPHRRRRRNSGRSGPEASPRGLALHAARRRHRRDRPARRERQPRPDHAGSVTALEKLVLSADHQLRVTQILEPLYRAADQWKKLVAVLEPRRRSRTTRADKARLLGEVGRLHEERGNDVALAFDAWSRAFVVEPLDDEAKGEVDRLAGLLGAWDEHVATYEQAMAATDDAMRVGQLLGAMARVHDEKRGDPRAAIETYERLVKHDSEDLTALDAPRGPAHDGRRLARPGERDDRKVERVFDPQERAELLRRAASVLEELLGDPAAAIRLYERAAQEDDQIRSRSRASTGSTSQRRTTKSSRGCSTGAWRSRKTRSTASRSGCGSRSCSRRSSRASTTPSTPTVVCSTCSRITPTRSRRSVASTSVRRCGRSCSRTSSIGPVWPSRSPIASSSSTARARSPSASWTTCPRRFCSSSRRFSSTAATKPRFRRWYASAASRTTACNGRGARAAAPRARALGLARRPSSGQGRGRQRSLRQEARASCVGGDSRERPARSEGRVRRDGACLCRRSGRRGSGRRARAPRGDDRELRPPRRRARGACRCGVRPDGRAVDLHAARAHRRGATERSTARDRRLPEGARTGRRRRRVARDPRPPLHRREGVDRPRRCARTAREHGRRSDGTCRAARAPR